MPKEIKQAKVAIYTRVGTKEQCSDKKRISGSTVFCHGKEYKRILNGYSVTGDLYCDYDEPCHDCGVTFKQYHHWGCDIEKCPACGGQLTDCDCDIEKGKVE